MPARRRAREVKNLTRSWTLLLSPAARTETEARIRRDHPDVAKALDWMSSQFAVYSDGCGFTVFTDWILEMHPKAAKRWPTDTPFFSPEGLYGPVFP